MANTFKLKTKAGVTTLATVYTVPSNTTAVVLGCIIGNTTANSVNATVTVSSDTSDTETNETVTLLKDAPIPAGSSIEVLGGAKIVLQATDVLKVDCDTADKVDAILSIMEID